MTHIMNDEASCLPQKERRELAFFFPLLDS